LHALADLCRRLSGHPRFQGAVLAIILLNAVVIGLETSPAVMARWGDSLHVLNGVIVTLFVLEIAVRLAAHGARPQDFFRDGWNVFDLVVVSASLLPGSGPFATVARLARVLRGARLVSALPELRLIVGTMLRSIPSMGHVIALLALLLYVYGVLGYYLFSAVDPAHWGSLGRATATLFQILTLEGWVEIQRASTPGHPMAWLFYGSFIVLAVFVVINLFIAVVLNNLEAARREQEAAERRLDPAAGALERIERLRDELEALEQTLRRHGPPGR
jgi:voltage-gated sodium channel